jgi:hypothetical protein
MRISIQIPSFHRRKQQVVEPPTEDDYLQRERTWLSNLIPSPELTHEMIIAQMAEIDQKRREIAAK